MAVASVSFDYENVATTTLALIRPQMADNIFKANPTVFYLLAAGRVEMFDGGKWLEEPLIYARNDTVQSYEGYDRLQIHPTEEFTMARYGIKQFAGSLSLSGLEDLQNAGESQVFDLVAKKMNVLEMTMREFLDEMIHAVTGKGPKDFLGFGDLIEATAGATQGTIGGIDRQTYAWWQNRYQECLTADITANMRTFYNLCGQGLSTPDLIITSYPFYEAYEQDNADILRVHDIGLLDAGFENVRFRRAVVMPNVNCVDQYAYFVNTDHIRLKIHRRRNFVMTPFRQPIDQDARVSQILCAGNMTINNSRHVGVLNVTDL